MKKWKRILSACIACAMVAGTLPVLAESVPSGTEPETAAEFETNQEPAQEMIREGQLTAEDLSALNNGTETVYTHNGSVTFVDGTCTDKPVVSSEDAAAVVDSMMTMIGADANTQFIPWREFSDPMGNRYYVFQQMYKDTTVYGGAVKVITDADGKMIGLSSSVEAKMPDVDFETSITAEEAEQIVISKELAENGLNVELLSQYTGKIILPVELKYDINREEEYHRFAWVVYTNNPSGNVKDGSDLPYLAHYVSMSGEYLYNMPAIIPADEAGQSGYDVGYIFEFMEPVDYTGYVDMSDGSEKEITVTLMRDKRTGMYYLGNIERKIAVAQCYEYVYNDGQIILESSPDNKEWDQVGLLSLYNYCRAWDYYNEIGWTGGDGENTPILILNNFCDDHRVEVNNACYAGKIYGAQCFIASKINDYSQCLDVIGHEFTHCVTGSVMTYNSYTNDYGAINEGMSDIQGKNCAMMFGDCDEDNWILGSNSKTPIRSMDNPHRYGQPEYTWDLHYMAKVSTPTQVNDHGGVHINSSLLNQISYYLISEGGMTLDEARIFWFMTDCVMVPKTDYAQLSELLPWVLKTAGMDQYADTLSRAIEATRLGVEEMPETVDDDRAHLKLVLPGTEAFSDNNWAMQEVSIQVDELIDRIITFVGQLKNEDFSGFPESLQRVLAEENTEKETEAETSSESFVSVVFSSLLEMFSEDEPEPEPVSDEEKQVIENEITEWFLNEFGKYFFSTLGSAGQDGSTMNMVVRPGRAIPTLVHMTMTEGSQTPDQIVYAVYIGGKWFDFNLNPENNNTYDELRKAVLGENYEKLFAIKSIDDFLDLFTTEIKGGETIELSSDGLEEIVLPAPTPFEEKEFGVIEPGPKSRPKEVTETSSEEITEAADFSGETELLDEAA